MTSYLDTLAKIQDQGIETLKQAQTVQLAAVTSLRDAAKALPALPKVEGFPTLAELAELNASFATKVLEQQTAFVSQLAGVFTAAK
jgi:hypothetical protein